ncbi:DUF2075 domain-containing protein [Roseococcus sp. DSY-14]|uniref:DUF2075 domain-containing protein n=1 Tax=Roseococcus sp. DSY-14 TaxID=3369650 RepID=UPI00387B2A4B
MAAAQARRHATTELTQLNAWASMLATLHRVLAMPEATGWTLLLEYDLLRLEKRADAVLLTDRAVVVLEWKDRATAHAAADLRQAEDYALDLHDFHAGCRAHPVVPVLVATAAPDAPLAPPLIPSGVWQPIAANAATLPAVLRAIQAAIPPPDMPLDAVAWRFAPYRPVPSVLEAAAMLFDRHRSAEMTAARADAANLTRTTAAIRTAIARAQAGGERLVVFVTGIPGAGKTLCGLNIAFGGGGAVFLTGNAPLVEVLRADLARREGRRHSARHAVTALQNVHKFLETYVAARPDEAPPEHVIVFDEAQRAWDQAQATRDTQRRVSRLTESEPAHTLEIMARAPGWSVIVALIGNGQEINTGEAGLAEWGRVIAASGQWRALAAPRVLSATEAAQRLADGPQPWLELEAALDLQVPMRAVREPAGAAWVDAVLAGDAPAAARVAAGCTLPFLLTRDLGALRGALRCLARGNRRAGLVAAAGAKRLRAEGLGVQVPDIARFFLDRWPDPRASDALETFATEYDCQGLELDVVGLAWGGDFIRAGHAWLPRDFVGRRWNLVAKPQTRDFIRNTYRVLLTRARYETVIWVPPGCTRTDEWHDPTRPAAEMDAIADFLLACGARPLAEALAPASKAQPALPP